MADLLQVKNLQTSFFTPEGEVRAIDGVSLEIGEGKTLGLVGESGCGKSVTSLSIMRLIPSPPGKIVGGEILYRGRDLLKLNNEEMRKIRSGEHGARSAKQAVAIGLSEARRAGVDLPPPRKGKAKAKTRRSAKYAYEAGQGRRKPRRRPRVSRAVSGVLKKEPKRSASHRALARQARGAARRHPRRTAPSRTLRRTCVPSP